MDQLERQQELIAQQRHEQFQERLHAQIQAQLGAIQRSPSPDPEPEAWGSRAQVQTGHATGLNSHPISNFRFAVPRKALPEDHEVVTAEAGQRQELAAQPQQQQQQQQMQLQLQLASLHEHRMSVIREQQQQSQQRLMDIQQDQVFTVEEERLSVIPEEEFSPTLSSHKASSPDGMRTFYLSASEAPSTAGSSQPSSRKPSQQLADPLCPPTLITTITGPSTPHQAAAATQMTLRSGYAPLDPLDELVSPEDTHDAFRWFHDLQHKAVESINTIANKHGGTGFLPDSLQQECDKAAVILRTFCTKGVYYDHTTTALSLPKPKMHKGFLTIPPRVITRAVALAIFTTFRAGLQLTGASGSGILIARLPDGSWGPPAAIQLHSLGAGVVSLGVDVYDGVMVVNSRRALDSFMRSNVRVGGGGMTVVAGPWGVSHNVEWTSTNGPKTPSPNPHLAPPTPQNSRSPSVSSDSPSIPAVPAVSPPASVVGSPGPSSILPSAPLHPSPPSSAGQRNSFFSVSSLSSQPSEQSRRSSISSTVSSHAPATPQATAPSPTFRSTTSPPPPQEESTSQPLDQNRQQPDHTSGEKKKTKKKVPRFAPVFSYVKSRGLYAGFGCDCTNIKERSDANSQFYGQPDIKMGQILRGEAVPPVGNESLQNLYDVIRGAELGTRRRSKTSGRRPSVDSSIDSVIRNTYIDAAGTNNLFDSMVISGANTTKRSIW